MSESETRDQVFVTIDRSYSDKKEELRVSIGEYKGKRFASVRVFWLGERGDWLPGKSGVAIRVRELRQVIDALEAIHKQIGGA